MSSGWDEDRDDAARAAKLAAYRAQGIEITASFPSRRAWTAAGPAWSWAWLEPRLVAVDHLRYMLHGDRVVDVMTQPYGIDDPGRYAGQLAELTTAGFEVDVCPRCSPHYPGYTIAVIHHRPADHPPSLRHEPSFDLKRASSWKLHTRARGVKPGELKHQ
jgi:hypothetical protein